MSYSRRESARQSDPVWTALGILGALWRDSRSEGLRSLQLRTSGWGCVAKSPTPLLGPPVCLYSWRLRDGSLRLGVEALYGEGPGAFHSERGDGGFTVDPPDEH